MVKTRLVLIEGMMDTPKPDLLAYVRRLVQIVLPLEPVFIYLYQHPVDEALERISSTRGKGRVKHQVNWKTESPYCKARGYEGRDGWLQMYRDYRMLTDELYAGLQLRKTAVDVSSQNWPEYNKTVLRFLDLPTERLSHSTVNLFDKAIFWSAFSSI